MFIIIYGEMCIVKLNVILSECKIIQFFFIKYLNCIISNKYFFLKIEIYIKKIKVFFLLFYMYLFYLWVLKILKYNLIVKIKLVCKGIM